ncbi:PRC-barrel domain-containing protein [Rhodopila sp.]|uniref:PRC-barrel domain-containing protein n=1 Tax=Rhodopila sp. TaxID=2480087 RepID=UPI003D0AE18E
MKLLTIGAALLVISLGTGAQSFAQSKPMSPAKAAVMADHTLRISKLLHARIYNAAGEEIGTIDDVLVDPKVGQPRAILSVGKYLGKKDELVAVPLDSIEFGSDRMVMPQGTKQHMAEMRRFSYGSPLEGGGG